VYIDLSFFDELKRRFAAPGEFAQAYVIAHEVGHHVQHLLGIDAAVGRQRSANPSSANRLSVAMELQADCLAQHCRSGRRGRRYARRRIGWRRPHPAHDARPRQS
jgi:predicted metalloprotease